MSMNAKILAIKKAFKGKLVGNAKMKYHVAEVLSKMPNDIIDFVTKNVWFMASMEDAWAFTFTGSDLRDKHLVFLSDELLAEDEEQIHWTIAHEIGHVVSGHKNRFFEKFSRRKINEQERQADKFAAKYT